MPETSTSISNLSAGVVAQHRRDFDQRSGVHVIRELGRERIATPHPASERGFDARCHLFKGVMRHVDTRCLAQQ